MGRVSGLFGVKGWVKVYSYTQPREAILDYRQWYLQRNEAWQRFEVAEGKRHGKGIIARFEGISDRDVAAELVDSDIAVDRADLPATEEGRYYWADLEGLKIVSSDGADFGRVAYLLETGSNDVLVTTGKPERLIPFIMGKVVQDVNLAEGVITVDWEED